MAGNIIWLKRLAGTARFVKVRPSPINAHTMANADPVELEKFSQLAHKWWDPNSEFKPLHDINPLRLGYIDRHANLAGRSCWMSAAAAASCPRAWRD